MPAVPGLEPDATAPEPTGEASAAERGGPRTRRAARREQNGAPHSRTPHKMSERAPLWSEPCLLSRVAARLRQK